MFGFICSVTGSRVLGKWYYAWPISTSDLAFSNSGLHSAGSSTLPPWEYEWNDRLWEFLYPGGVSISESREAVPQIIPRFVARYHWHAGYQNSLQPGLSLASSSLHCISRLASRRRCPRASLHRSPPVNLCLSHLASLQGQAPSHLASHQVRRLANQVRCLRLSRVSCRRCSRLVSRVPRCQASLRHSLQVSHPASHPHLHRLSRLVSRR